MFLQFTFPNTLPRRLFCCQGKKKKKPREADTLATVQISLLSYAFFFAGVFDLKFIWSSTRYPRDTENRKKWILQLRSDTKRSA